jgi:hypothetical protein
MNLFAIFGAAISRSFAQRSLIGELLALLRGRTQPAAAHLVKYGKLTSEEAFGLSAATAPLTESVDSSPLVSPSASQHNSNRRSSLGPHRDRVSAPRSSKGGAPDTANN